MANEVNLKVMEALQEEAYKGIVRMDSQTMREIGIHPGDIVEIEGNRKTLGIADRAYPTDIGQAVMRMDGIIRRNAKTGIGETVKVRAAEIKEAKNIVIAPVQEGVTIQADPYIFKRGLLGRPILKGDIVALGGAKRRRRTITGSPFEEIFDVFEQGFMGSFGALKFIVVSTNPKEGVIITEETDITLSPKAVVVSEEKIPDVNYEDIGGLGDEVKKIREMVEIPLKYPELFSRLGIDPPKGVLLYGPPGTGKTLIAKAVATESDAHFILLNGPEVINKFYGECVASNSLVMTNGAGLTTMEEAMKDESQKIVGLDMEEQKIKILPITDKYDKGLQNTLTIKTPHNELTLTPTSKLLKVDNAELKWAYVKDLKIGDKVAIAKRLPQKQEIPNLINYLKDNNYVRGKELREFLDSMPLKNKEIVKILGVSQRKYEDWKYRKTIPAWVIKKLYPLAENKNLDLKLLGKGRLPSKINEKFMYIFGLLSGDGHLRYTYKGDYVTAIQLTSKSKEVVSTYLKYLKEVFGIDSVKSDKKYSYVFSSSAIGTLLYKLGIPKSNKAHTLEVPNWAILLPEDLIASYLKGLYDSDGYIHLPKSGKQICYYSMSEKMARGLMMLLLRFEIQSTFRKKKDGTHEVTISNVESIKRFRKIITLNNQFRNNRLSKEIKVKYNKPVYERIPVVDYVKKIAKEHKLSGLYLLRNGINPNIGGYTKEQLRKVSNLFKLHGINENVIDKLNLLAENEILWSPIKKIDESRAHVYDLTVPDNHNFVANGFIVHNSERRVREIFEEAEKNAPSIIFIDEIDAIAPKREAVHGEVERRVVSSLLTMLDGLKSRGKVVVIAATNRPNSIDPALRRPGRFDREISIAVPGRSAREEILKIHTRNMPLKKDVNLAKLAEITHGFVGADLAALCRESAINVLRKVLPDLKQLDGMGTIPEDLLNKLIIGDKDFKEALKSVRPSALREILIETPNVSWEQIGGLEKIKQELMESIEWPLKKPEMFKRLGIRPTKGVLLYGPPGTGKTLLAKAVAASTESNFILVKGPELLDKFVGESEKGVKRIFEKARQVAPTIIFFDEIDSLAPRRGLGMDGTRVTERVVNTLLAEMDGLEDLTDVLVIAATNRPDIIDPALLRPGRFDSVVLIPPPDIKSREEIFKIHTRNMPLNKNVDIVKLAQQTSGYVGADIESICREAALIALRADINAKEVDKKHFDEAMKKVVPSVEKETMDKYEEIEKEYLSRAKAGLIKEVPPSYFG